MYILLLARITLAGILTFAMLSVFYIRRALAGRDRSSGIFRRILWQYIFTLVVLTIVWPGIINYPLNIPEWVLSLRIFRLTDKSFLYNILSQESRSVVLRSWSFVYPAGAAVYIVFSKRLLWENKWQGGAVRKFLSREERINESRNFAKSAWEKYLAIWRDRLGYYRKAELHYIRSIPDNLGNKLYTRLNNILNISEKSPPEDENSYEGAVILDRLHHPYLITYILNETTQIILWFVPNWWFSSKFLQKDIQNERMERITRKLKPKRGKKIRFLNVIPNIITGIILVLFLLLYLWQMPAVYLPDLEAADNNLPEDNFGISEVLSDNFRPSAIDSSQLIMSDLIPVIYEYNGGINVEKLTREGSLEWLEFIDLPARLRNGDLNNLDKVELIDSKMLDTGKLALICEVLRTSGSSEYWYLLFTKTGSLIDKYIVPKPSGFPDIGKISFKIASDGGFIVFTQQQDNMQNETTVIRFAHSGKKVYDLAYEDFLSVLNEQQDIKYLLFNAVVPDNDGGYYIILTYQDPDNMHNNNAYYLCINILHVNELGTISLIRNLDFHDSYSINSCVVDLENNLYIGGSTRFAAAQLAAELFHQNNNSARSLTSGNIIALSPDGNLLWQKTIPQNGDAYISEMHLQDNTISVINYLNINNTSKESNQLDKYLWQLGTDGMIEGRFEITGEEYIFIQPGRIYAEAPEELPDELEQ